MGETLDRPGTLSEATRERLMGVSVATLCTALYKRGLRNQTIQDVRPVAPKGRNMVGPAFTLRYIPAREDLNTLEVFRNPDHPRASPSSAARPARSLSWTAAKTRAPPRRAASSPPG